MSVNTKCELNASYLIQDMHCAGKICKEHCNPNSEAHTGIVEWINLVKQEQCFKKWNKYKDSALKMSPATFRFMCQMDVFYSIDI